MLRIINLTYRIEGRPLFEQATANIPTGHKVGLVGRNGTGKSTLFRLLTGETDVDGGEITMPRNWRIAGVAQEAPGGPTSLLDTVLEADTERASLIADARFGTAKYTKDNVRRIEVWVLPRVGAMRIDDISDADVSAVSPITLKPTQQPL